MDLTTSTKTVLTQALHEYLRILELKAYDTKNEELIAELRNLSTEARDVLEHVQNTNPRD